ncbi:MAG: hypothetical protein KDA69_08865, partial [Planctomycetaceae bacterium]|nr:hypothetical protein [Planctomycetaceae bacterium]
LSNSRTGQILAAGLCVFGLVFLLGCPGKPDPAPPTAGPKPPPQFDSWENPAAVLVLTGDQHGYLEPCGCSDKQAGGLARRADLFRFLREDKGWNVVGLDNGGFLRTDRVTREQSLVKLDFILSGLNEIGYRATGTGYEELKYGSTKLYETYANEVVNDGFDMPFVSANVTLFGTRVEGIPPQEFQIIEAGSLKVGVTSVITDTVRKELDIEGITRDENDVKIDPASDVLAGVIQNMQDAGAELLVLLSHGPIEDSKALAEAFPQFQIVVTARSVEDPRNETIMVGNTLFCEVGQKGKNAGVVGVFKGESGISVKYQLIEIEQEYFANHPSMTTLMQGYQNALTERKGSILASSISDPEAGSFVGVDQCKTCHKKAYGKWLDTKHAHAYESLLKGRENFDGKWVPRPNDPECLNCHTVGWDPQEALRYESGFVDMETTPHLAGQQCENCHGPGSKHVAIEQSVKMGAPLSDDVAALRTQMKLNLKTAEKLVCARCHDYENSPHFDFNQYWGKITHSGIGKD